MKITANLCSFLPFLSKEGVYSMLHNENSAIAEYLDNELPVTKSYIGALINDSNSTSMPRGFVGN